MSKTCSHEKREFGFCPDCGACEHEMILNGGCYYCGETDLKTTVKPAADELISAERLVRRQK